MANRPIHVAVGVNLLGDREVLGLWAGTGGEGAKHWLSVLAQLQARGVQDVLILCCDGLKGLPDAVGEVWPQATVRTRVAHLMRGTLRYSSKQHWGAISAALKQVYQAPSLSAAEAAFEAFTDAWGTKYPAVIKLWQSAWGAFTPFLAFPTEIRRLIYTTNARA